MSNELVMMAFVFGLLLGVYGIKSLLRRRPIKTLLSFAGGSGLIYLAIMNHVMGLLFNTDF